MRLTPRVVRNFPKSMGLEVRVPPPLPPEENKKRWGREGGFEYEILFSNKSVEYFIGKPNGLNIKCLTTKMPTFLLLFSGYYFLPFSHSNLKYNVFHVTVISTFWHSCGKKCL